MLSYSNNVIIEQDKLSGQAVLPWKRLDQEESEHIVKEACGAWGNSSLEEVDALIRKRRVEDWGEVE